MIDEFEDTGRGVRDNDTWKVLLPGSRALMALATEGIIRDQLTDDALIQYLIETVLTPHS